MADNEASYVALNRFGFGAGKGEVARVNAQGGAAKWLENQILQGGSYAGKLSGTHLSSAAIGEEWQKAQTESKQRDDRSIMATTRTAQRDRFQAEMLDRVEQAVTTQMPFAERLVHFWSNHFTISGQAKAVIVGMMGAYEREAIRPNIFARFEDLLYAVETHPAMLIYLDNNQSVGPKSLVGKNRKRGLNENLAREILELHTLGVNGGYDQRDVTEFAKIITGWGVRGANQQGEPGFLFNYNTHEPGAKYLMGVQYGSSTNVPDRENAEYLAMQEGKAALRNLARHPSTAKFISTKLARHFIADKPPQSAIAALEKTFMDTGGDLKSIYRTLISLPEVWANPLPKYKTPHEYIITTFRMLGVPFDKKGDTKNIIRQALNMMDHAPFMALSPAGWGDEEGDWLSPDSLMNRIDWVHSITNRYQGLVTDPASFADETVGVMLDSREIAAISAAPSKSDGTALVLLSPAAIRR